MVYIKRKKLTNKRTSLRVTDTINRNIASFNRIRLSVCTGNHTPELELYIATPEELLREYNTAHVLYTGTSLRKSKEPSAAALKQLKKIASHKGTLEKKTDSKILSIK